MSRSPRPSRRTTLLLAALAWPVLAACDIDPPESAPSPTPTPEPSRDVVLVQEVVAALAEAEGVLGAASAAVPALAASLAPATRAHAEHRALLAQALPEAPAPSSPSVGVPAARRRALGAVRRSERQLETRLQQACLQAASGDLARLLASITSSTAQHRVALDRAVQA